MSYYCQQRALQVNLKSQPAQSVTPHFYVKYEWRGTFCNVFQPQFQMNATKTNLMIKSRWLVWYCQGFVYCPLVLLSSHNYIKRTLMPWMEQFLGLMCHGWYSFPSLQVLVRATIKHHTGFRMISILSLHCSLQILLFHVVQYQLNHLWTISINAFNLTWF